MTYLVSSQKIKNIVNLVDNTFSTFCLRLK